MAVSFSKKELSSVNMRFVKKEGSSTNVFLVSQSDWKKDPKLLKATARGKIRVPQRIENRYHFILGGHMQFVQAHESILQEQAQEFTRTNRHTIAVTGIYLLAQINEFFSCSHSYCATTSEGLVAEGQPTINGISTSYDDSIVSGKQKVAFENWEETERKHSIFATAVAKKGQFSGSRAVLCEYWYGQTTINLAVKYGVHEIWEPCTCGVEPSWRGADPTKTGTAATTLTLSQLESGDDEDWLHSHKHRPCDMTFPNPRHFHSSLLMSIFKTAPRWPLINRKFSYEQPFMVEILSGCSCSPCLLELE